MTVSCSAKPSLWIASVYFFQALPYVFISTMVGLIYQHYGLQNAFIVSLVSVMMLPWAIKPIFSPFLERVTNQKQCILLFQALITALFFALSLCIHCEYFIAISLVGFLCIAILSALHDIVVDGFYLFHLQEAQQKKYVGLRTVFYQLGRLVVKGGVLLLVSGVAYEKALTVWQLFLFVLCLLSGVIAMFHLYALPSLPRKKERIFDEDYFSIFKQLLKPSAMLKAFLFIFIFNFSDAQLQRIIPLFLADNIGLHLDMSQLGVIYGLLGGIAFVGGVVVSSVLIRRLSIHVCLVMTACLLLIGPASFWFINEHSILRYVYIAVFMTQFTTGLANGAFMGYLLAVANRSTYPISAYTICTAIMAISYIVFGTLGGLVEQLVGYKFFFWYLLLANLFVIFITLCKVRHHA